jgi:uncharacterized membrane protein HdeD (DUF308 family)
MNKGDNRGKRMRNNDWWIIFIGALGFLVGMPVEINP